MDQCKEEHVARRSVGTDIVEPGGAQHIRHLCGRQKWHHGMHECFCGYRFARRSIELCQCWRANSTRKGETAVANRFRVSEEHELTLYGRGRLIDVDQPEEEKEQQR